MLNLMDHLIDQGFVCIEAFFIRYYEQFNNNNNNNKSGFFNTPYYVIFLYNIIFFV
jgi:hypothetical protein